MVEELRILFGREIDTVLREIAAYPDDASPWREVAGLPNVGGTLVLHLAGNLRHFVGAQLGGSGYVRDRPLEFSARGLSRDALSATMTAARAEVDAAFAGMEQARLEAPTELPNGPAVSTRIFLLHLLSHLAFHLGQIDYHRRAATGDPASVGVLPQAALAP